MEEHTREVDRIHLLMPARNSTSLAQLGKSGELGL